MSDILENDLVWRYFGCDAHEIRCPNGNEYLEHMALRVLKSMQEPIRKGERYLESRTTFDVNEYGNFTEEKVLDTDLTFSKFHPFSLRLPDRFQTAGNPCEHRHEMHGCHKILGCPPNAWDGDIQPPAEPEKCTCGEYKHRCWNCKDKPSDAVSDSAKAVEAKIKEISETEGVWLSTNKRIEFLLHELVALARR